MMDTPGPGYGKATLMVLMTPARSTETASGKATGDAPAPTARASYRSGRVGYLTPVAPVRERPRHPARYVAADNR
jgi:hypothetical protein